MRSVAFSSDIISIHALVKRATLVILYVQGMEVNFNPRPREEGDGIDGIRGLSGLYFNPRPREEGDELARWSVNNMYFISIHALVKRATSYR